MTCRGPSSSLRNLYVHSAVYTVMIRSRVGLGSATLETVLPDEDYSPGDAVEAVVEVTGGTSDQRIEVVHCSIVAMRDTGGDEVEYEVDRFDLLEEFVIEASETARIPFTVTFPQWTPITFENVGVRIDLGADIRWAVDPHDSIEVAIVPDPLLAATLEAVSRLEFEFKRSWLHAVDWVADREFVQVFEFDPGQDYADRVERLLLTPIPETDRLRLNVEIDRIDAVADQYDLDFNRDEVPFVVRSPKPSLIQGRLQHEIESHS
jgi:sporulation-control protein